MALDDEQDDDSAPYPSDGEQEPSAPGVTDTDDGGAIVEPEEPETDEPTAVDYVL